MQNLLSNAGVGKFLDILICQNEKVIIIEIISILLKTFSYIPQHL